MEIDQMFVCSCERMHECGEECKFCGETWTQENRVRDDGPQNDHPHFWVDENPKG